MATAKSSKFYKLEISNYISNFLEVLEFSGDVCIIFIIVLIEYAEDLTAVLTGMRGHWPPKHIYTYHIWPGHS